MDHATAGELKGCLMLTMTSLGAAGTVTGSKHLLEHDGFDLFDAFGKFILLLLRQGFDLVRSVAHASLKPKDEIVLKLLLHLQGDHQFFDGCLMGGG